jgi:uncharacterized Zn-binding protein involved in type VI secretion
MGNININGKSAVHAKSEGILTTVDTCLTPPFCIPINYTNVAESKMADMGASSVKIQGSPACNSKSNFKISKGDAPGCCGGTSSGSTQQMAEFLTFSNDVMIEGKPAVRNGDKMVSNLRNTAPQPLVQPPAGNATAKTTKAPEAIKGDYSQQVDLSDFVGMNHETGQALQSLPYAFRDKDGKVLQNGQTNRHGDTQRVETVKQEKIVLYVGDGDWQLSVD